MTNTYAVIMSAAEVELLATAIEVEATAHDHQKGSCPADLSEATSRAAFLRGLVVRTGSAATSVVSLPPRASAKRAACVMCRRFNRTVASLAPNMHICRQCCFDAIEAMDEAELPTEIKYPDGHGWSLIDGEWVPY